jgi:tetratricopeptide (TPR) repeat protein
VNRLPLRHPGHASSWRWLPLVLILAVLGGCASAPQSARIAFSPPEGLPLRVELTETPFFPQDAYQGGPAAVATVLVAQGLDVTPEALVAEIPLPERQGNLQAELRATVRARERVAYRLEPELNAILAEVAAGHPVVVFQNLGLGVAPRWHYAVVVGYDLEAGEVILRSGTIERHVNSVPLFERTWSRADRWAFVAVPPEHLPATARPLAWLRAVNELEQTGFLGSAKVGYESAIARWPGEAVGYLGLANTQFAAGDLSGAERALRVLLEHQPGRHEAWNNLAHVLMAQQCGFQARAAAACATALAPEARVYRRTERSVLGADTSGLDCRPLPPCPSYGLQARGPATGMDVLR